MTRSRIAEAALVVIAAITLTACSPEPERNDSEERGTPESQTSPPAGVEVIASDLEAPWSIAFHEGTPLISERDSARILELDETGAAREIGRVDGVVPNGEGGLLGIAVHEGFAYTYFTADDENRIERFPLTGEPGSLALGDSEPVFAGIPAAGFHNGGRIAFGPDGMLYATTGDAGARSDAQELESLAGKILRLTPEGEAPTDNPFAGSPVYSYGHRNPQGIAWDSDGTMYASEFGQDTWDELNLIEAGNNYGWPEVEGIAQDESFVDPVQQWEPAEASPSGIAITDQTIHVANLRGQRLRDIPLAELGESSERLDGEYGRLRDVVVAPDGSLWVLTNNTDGRGNPGPNDDRVLRVPAAP
ncbi:PQQ-dependent sugar dehydrogenase [Brevibacterium sp.]|uniref:PQQ-dependent sugar dehydrogenase n=1 Tax=Brevibacterium sp. TaxID=1701 RepID=UPI0028115FD0|nr:PQQ-dependent sugar dehydrogenase [Brevibacterium sp.]